MLSTLATFLEDYTAGLIEVSREEGRQAGNERITHICVRAALVIMDASRCTLDEAMEKIGVPDEVYDRVRSLAQERLSSENDR